MGCHNFINLHDNNLIQITARQKHHIRPTIKCIHCNFRHKHQKELVRNGINLKKLSLSWYCKIAMANFSPNYFLPGNNKLGRSSKYSSLIYLSNAAIAPQIAPHHIRSLRNGERQPNNSMDHVLPTCFRRFF